VRDRFLEARLLQELPAEHRDAAMADVLRVVETTLGETGSSIDARLNELFAAFGRLGDAPTSSVARQEVQRASTALATSFNDVASRMRDARDDADFRVRGAAEDVNALAAQLAIVNRSVGAAGSAQSTMHLKDQQSAVLRQLSELIDVHVLDRGDGVLDVTIGNGKPLVLGETAYAITAQTTPPSGYVALMSNGVDVTSQITAGRLGGLLAARDVTVPDQLQRLDTLAAAVVTEVNAVHAAGFDQTGAAAGNLFSYSVAPTGVSGAARYMRLDPAVAADGRLVAAAGVAQTGDNANALALARLGDARVFDGGTATLLEGWSRFVYRVGRDTQSAVDGQTGRAAIVRQVDALRDSVSGVSLDEEAMMMMKYQRAYEANARYFRVIDEALDTLFSAVGR
jgi:flagellar hook-associated protein 1 FlgK